MTVHQLLFGYDQGHDLLSGSTPLPSDARRRALVLSDLSGAEPDPAFDGYLTGYPLPSAGAYALARTWYAPEMPRPGCVWTHTLLVSFADLATIPEPSLLLSLFVRPTGPVRETTQYATPVTLTDGTADGLRPFDPATARDVLSALYADIERAAPPPAVAVTRSHPGDAETLVLAVWAQQWPRLRRSFSFCTGALELREIDGAPLDLQFTPQPRPALGSSQVRLVPEEGAADSGSTPPWLTEALQDLTTPDRRGFRQRLRAYGADVPGERWAFAALATAVSLSHDDLRTAALLERLSHPFPDPSEGGTLKAELLRRPRGTQASESELERLTALLTTSHHRAFAPDALDVDGDVDALWSGDRSGGLALLRSLLETRPNPWGRDALQRLIATASPVELFQSLADSEPGIRTLFDRRPELLHEPKLWSGSRLLRDHAMAALRERPDADWERIGRAMLDAGVERYADEVEARIGTRAAQIALDWLLADRGRHLPRAWLGVVAQHVGALATLAEARPERPIGALLLDLGPSNRALRSVPPLVWMPLRDDMGRDLLTFDAFLLSLGLFDAGGQGRPVVEDLFQTVHDAARSLSLRARHWISLHAPSPGWKVWESVSPDEELRRALVRRSLAYGWSPDVLLRSARKRKTQAALASTLKRTSGLNARRLYHALSDGIDPDS